MNLARSTLAPVVLALAALACGSQGTAASSEPAPSESTTQDIVATAKAAGQFNTLLAAVRAAGLQATLEGPGPFTVFAPTDDAFAKLPAAMLESLLEAENKAKLVSILSYHVVSGNVPSTEAAKLSSVTTVNGRQVRLSSEGGGLAINDAKVVTADIEASNGVIHVIDTVLIPE